MDLEKEVKRRRTFAIISHPDAGKTTLTEKLLLYGGAIHTAGAVKGKKDQKATSSDWMELEKKRGISVSTSVLQFQYDDCEINLLDTPGHKDFSEDTYRTLTAADAAVMLIDAAKGVEPQTIKLFEVCRMRGIPIFTFVNKLDRPSRECLDLIDEIEKVLGIRSCPMSMPIGSGSRFRGVYDRSDNQIIMYETDERANVTGRLRAVPVSDINDPKLKDLIQSPHVSEHDADEILEQLRTELELVEVAGDEFDEQRILAGKLSPVFFGSALNNFGLEHFLHHFVKIAPSPVGRNTANGTIEPTDARFSGFIFKIQANMDPAHRDRVAFMRICSGHFKRGMEVKHARLKKPMRLARSLNFFGQDRVIVEEAWPGDIVGLLDTSGDLRIGDTLCAGGKIIEYDAIPTFTPEHFAEVRILDPMKRKQLKKGLDQLAQEGVIQVYQQKGLGDKDPVLGAVGALQFDVLKWRLQFEYSVDVKIERLGFAHARWLGGEYKVEDFSRREDNRVVLDRDDNLVVLFKSDWSLRWAEDNYKDTEFLKVAPLQRSL